MQNNTSSFLRRRKIRIWFRFVFIFIGIIFFFVLNISLGSVLIPPQGVLNSLLGFETASSSWPIIVLNYRLPQAITAFLSGSCLALAGLMMQTLFRNPLAGPSILGVSSGASLGVALLILFSGVGISGLAFNVALSFSALIGAGVVLIIILLLARIIKNNIVLLIAGIMIGYLTSSIVGILNVFSSAEDVKTFMLWGLGSFSEVGWKDMPVFSLSCVIGAVASVFVIKPLNAFLIGEEYARNLGVSLSVFRVIVIVIAGFLTAIITAWCGPIAFIGLAVPHLGRVFFKNADHKILLPGVFLLGGLIALICNLIARLPGSDGILPINTITSAFGAPVVLWFLIRRNVKM
ncbi:MAG: iron chelate uptake ABC transporter family permease subunit [Bacteroidales bacterium]